MKSQQDLAYRAGGWVGAAYLICVLAVYPLYMHTFVDLGVTKYTGYLTLTVLWLPLLAVCLALRLCTMETAAPLSAWKDPGLLWPLAVLVSTLVSSVFSMNPQASKWGIGSYYGGCMLVVCALLGFLAARFWARRNDCRLILGAFLLTAMAVVVFDLLNALNLDPLGAYAGMADIERLQFYSTIGQMDFVAAFLSLALPMGVYSFLTAKTNGQLAFYGAASVVFMLALCCVSADCLLLGTLAFGAACICLPGFDTVQLRRAALCGAAFFGWDLALWQTRQAGVHFNIADDPIAWSVAKPIISVPAIVGCVILWAALSAFRNRPPVKLCLPGRVATGVASAAVVLGMVCANLGVRFPDALQKHLYYSDAWGNFRGLIWTATLKAYGTADPLRWLVGFGPGMTHSRLWEWSEGTLSGKLATFYAAHNEYLELLLCCGILGLVAWLGFVISRLRRGFMNSGDPLTAAVTLGLFAYLFQAMVNIRVSMVFPEVLVLLGLLDMLTLRREPTPEPETELPVPRGRKAVKKEKPVPGLSAPVRALTLVAAAWCTMPFWWQISHSLCAFLWEL